MNQVRPRLTCRIANVVNPDILGKTYPPSAPYLVGREKIREFAAAVKSQNPLSCDVAAAQAAGYSDVVAPPTFAVLVAQRAEYELLGDPEAQVDFQHLVHGDETFSYQRPIVAGDELVATVTVSSLKTLGPMTMLGTTTSLTDQSGAEVATVTAGFVIRNVEETK